MSDFITGSAGASARRENQRRQAKDDDRVRENWGDGRIGKIALALTPERQSTGAWRSGGIGEGEVGRRLDAIAGPDVRVFHDQVSGRSKANIDHMVVTPSAVWVIDAKQYQDERPERRTEGGFLRPLVEHLYVGGRPKDQLLDGVLGQVERVRSVLEDGVPIRPALCFVDSDWSLFADTLLIRGVLVGTPKMIARKVRASVSDAPVLDVERVQAALRSAFRSA